MQRGCCGKPAGGVKPLHQNRVEPFATVQSVAARVREFVRSTHSDLQDSAPGQPLETFESEFNALACELFKAQVESNAALAQLCRHRGVKSTDIERWEDVPAVPTAAFKEAEWTCLKPHERVCVFHSSGTTQHRPSQHFHSADSLSLYEDSLRYGFERSALAPSRGGRVAMLFLTPDPSKVPRSSLAHMMSILNRDYAISGARFLGDMDAEGGWTIREEDWIRALNAATQNGCPVVVFGTAFNWVQALDCLDRRGLSFELPSGSSAMETGGYKGRTRALAKQDLHHWMQRRLGLQLDRIVCEYGMSELSSQAYDVLSNPLELATAPMNRGGDRLFRFPPWARVRVISPEHGREVAVGEVGLLRIVDLANAYSVMAVQTEDLGRKAEHGFEWIGRLGTAEARGCSLLSSAV